VTITRNEDGSAIITRLAEYGAVEYDRLAMTDDASELSCLRTQATFGCVLWETKP
jgi:hypothetical protein